MKKLLLVALLAIGVNVASRAQGFQQRTPAEQVAQLKTQVTGISADQETKLTAVYAAAAKTRDSLMQTANGDFASIRDKMTPLRAAQTAKIKAVLTADQQKQFDAIPQRGPGGGGAPRN